MMAEAARKKISELTDKEKAEINALQRAEHARFDAEQEKKASGRLVIDFDAAAAEARKNLTTSMAIRVGGKEFELPVSPPADYALFFLSRLRQTEGKYTVHFEYEDLNPMLESIFGAELLKKILATGVTLTQLQGMTKQITDVWEQGILKGIAETEGNEKTPA